MSLPMIPEAAPSYLAALIAANPALAQINQDAMSGSAAPMPPTIVANKGKFVKKVDKTEETITFPDNDANRAAGIVGMPVPQLQAVVLKAKPGKEKAWYATAFTPGNEPQAPDCASDDGIKPNAGVANKQCENCATCPQNVFGSGVKQDGTPSGGKACSDKKSIAIFAAGSAFKFAVPPASLRNWDVYCNQLSTKGIPLPAVITVFGFEQGDTDYKLTFTFGGMLAEAQLESIVKLLDSPEVKAIVEPRTAQLAAPAQNQAIEHKENVVDMAAEKAKRDAEEAGKAAADAEQKKKDAAAKAAATKKANAEKAAAAAAAAASTVPGLDALGGLDLGLGGSTPPADVAPALAAGATAGPSDDDLINSLGL